MFAYYFGLESDAADAFNAAFRIPNFLQNLFGEGALSASFIPVYAALLARGNRREADRVAGAVASLLALIVAMLVLAGVIATPLLIDAIAPGFKGAKRVPTPLGHKVGQKVKMCCLSRSIHPLAHLPDMARRG